MIPVTAVLIAAAFLYLRGWYQRPTLLSTWRLAAFVSGLASLWLAVASPLATLDHRLLTAHMVQHLLLMTVAAPLLLLGAAPGPVLQGSLAHRLGRIVTHPVFCWLASTAVVIGWHVPALFEVGMRSARWHAVEHTCFLAAGLLFWWPIVHPRTSPEGWPRWRIPLYLFLATLPCDALSAFLVFCHRLVYSHYQNARPPFDFSPLGDQECAGALMWVCVTFAYLAPAAVVVIQLLSPERDASLVEADHSLNGFPLPAIRTGGE